MANSSIVKNEVVMEQILEFHTAFPNEKMLSPEEYLKGGSREIILKTAAFFLGFKPFNSKYKDNRVLLLDIFSDENYGFANEVYSRIKRIEDTGNPIRIINTYSSLKLFECFFEKEEEEEETQTHAEFEINLFKAYMVINSDFVNHQKRCSSSTEQLHYELKTPMMLFCMHYPIADKENYNIGQIWIAQIVKAIFLFQFLESHLKTQTLLTAFLAHFDCLTWQEYLRRLLPLTLPVLNDKRETFTDISVNVGEKFEQDCTFIEKLIINDKDELNEDDFLTVRARPLYKAKHGLYRIIFDLFVVEKIFKGAYFLLRDINNKLPKGEMLPELKSFYGLEFSEKTLLYNAIKSIYPDKCIHFSGKQLDDMNIIGAPDYYIRTGNNILLFESKDFLIPAKKKGTFDYNIYKTEFQRILYFEELPKGKEKNKAVKQLINSVRNLLIKKFSADIDYHYKDVSIFPILIIHDHQYDTPGFNNLINYWFQLELEKLRDEGLFIHHIRPLVVINIDSLLIHQVGLSESMKLHEVMKLYYEKTRASKLSKVIPFSLFLDNLFNEIGLRKKPPIMDYVASVIFKDEWDEREKRKQS